MNKENEIQKTDEMFAEYVINFLASKVSKWTMEAGTMLPKSPEDIKTFIKEGNAVAAWSYGREAIPVGFGAITFVWPNNWVELGAIVVDKGFRKSGVGHAITKDLIALASAKYPNANLFALCNEKSLKLFLDNGAEILTDPTELPKEVFGECVSCPKFQDTKAQGKLCCDIPVIIRKL